MHFLCYTDTVQEKGLALMARKLRSALMAEGEFVDDGLSAFGDDGDITRELTRCLLNGHAVPGLEETFAALRALRPSHDHHSSERDGRRLVEMPTPQQRRIPNRRKPYQRLFYQWSMQASLVHHRRCRRTSATRCLTCAEESS